MDTDLTIDELSDREFCSEIEVLLRVGKADEAAGRLKTLLTGFCGSGHPLPARFLTVHPRDLDLVGWRDLTGRVKECEQNGKTISAIEIDFSSPSHFAVSPDQNGHLNPCIETMFFCDDIWPFSTSDRAGLLAGYSQSGSEWQGNFEDIDNTISIEGIADLYGATFLLRHAATTETRQARMLGACYVAVLVHLAIRDFAPRDVLPRPMAVIVGSNEDYPYFSAPAFAAR
jgi:hypothetical protein